MKAEVDAVVSGRRDRRIDDTVIDGSIQCLKMRLSPKTLDAWSGKIDIYNLNQFIILHVHQDSLQCRARW